MPGHVPVIPVIPEEPCPPPGCVGDLTHEQAAVPQYPVDLCECTGRVGTVLQYVPGSDDIERSLAPAHFPKCTTMHAEAKASPGVRTGARAGLDTCNLPTPLPHRRQIPAITTSHIQQPSPGSPWWRAKEAPVPGEPSTLQAFRRSAISESEPQEQVSTSLSKHTKRPTAGSHRLMGHIVRLGIGTSPSR